MKMHYLQHVPYETPARIETYFDLKGYEVSGSLLYLGEALPTIGDLDCLVIMGGPMGVYDQASYPWLNEEKAFIKACIKEGKQVIGVCLGAQLIADALGAKVYQGPFKEIGWMPIKAMRDELLEEVVVFHWHGDTFDLPSGASLLYKSESGIKQVYTVGKNILALQCHLEMTPSGVDLLVANGEEELVEGPYVQSKETILENKRHYGCNEVLLNNILDDFLEGVNP